jgi:hypothetical protein
MSPGISVRGTRSLVSIAMHFNPSTNNRLGHFSQWDNHYTSTPALRFSVLHPGPTQPRYRHEGASLLRSATDSNTTKSALISSASAKPSQIMPHDCELVAYM